MKPKQCQYALKGKIHQEHDAFAGPEILASVQGLQSNKIFQQDLRTVQASIHLTDHSNMRMQQ